MIDWIKRAWREFWQAQMDGLAADAYLRTIAPGTARLPLERRPEYIAAAREATIAQKNVRLASIARTRDALKDIIADKKRAKKRTSHLQAELARLTRLELELESGK